MKKSFTLIELMVVIAIIGVLASMLVPQVTNFVYKAKVSSTAASLRSFKMALDMLINDLGVKPNRWGWCNNDRDYLALMKRNYCPGSLRAQWNGPYIHSYPIHNVSSLFRYNTFWYYYDWPRNDGGTWGNYCGTGYGILLHTSFINYNAKKDVERTLLGKIDPAGNDWLYWCGFDDDRQVSRW